MTRYNLSQLHLDCANKQKFQHKIKKRAARLAFMMLAEWTGLEPATPGVTGRYSNQLNYHSSFTAVICNFITITTQTIQNERVLKKSSTLQ